jgi:hypothetical protein
MRAPLDRLSKQVTRFVDVSGLNKVAQGFEWIGKAAGNVFRMLSNIVPVMGAITGAASIAGMIKLVNSYAAWSHELVQAADNIGITTQSLQQFENATRLAGGNAEDMRNGLKSLHDTLSNMNIGRGNATDAALWFNKLGVNVRDANGHITATAEQVLPELIRKLSEMKDPADRARASVELLGAGGDKLVETFRQTHRSFTDWFTDAGRYKALTDDQIASMQRFTEAQGRLGVAFDTLGQQITAILTRDFGPLLDRFAQFVERNTPAILDAIDKLSARFAAWLGGIKWETIETGLKTVGDSLTAIGHAVEVIIGMQLGLWFVKAAAGVAQLTTALGSMGAVEGLGGVAAAAGGAGLLGALAGVAALVAGTYLLLSKGLPALFGDRPLPLARPPGPGGAQTTPNTSREGSGGVGPHHGLEPSRPGGGGHGGGPRLPATSAGGGVSGGSGGGLGGIDAPAGTPIARTGLATVTSASGRKFQVDERFAANFQGFINDYEKSGGQIGPDSGTLGERPNNASGHPVGAAIDINQIGRGVRSKRATSLDPRIEDELAKKWGFVSGNQWRSNDQGHFGIQSAEAARQALINNGVSLPNRAAGGASIMSGWNANNPLNLTPGKSWSGGSATTPGGLPIRVYKSMEDGIADNVRKLVEYQQQRHLQTVEQMAHMWNKTATPEYLNKIAKELGVQTNQPFDITDPAKAAAWIRGAQPQETGPGRLTEAQIAAGVNQGLAAPGAGYKTLTQEQLTGEKQSVPSPQAPVNGSVDVSITHKNAPPNAAVTATGSGSVNVAPVRVEHQDMANI